MDEVWKPVIGYEGIYEVSSFGRVKSCKRINLFGRRGTQSFKEKILRLTTKKTNYKCVTLKNQNVQKYWLIHRLVAIAFIPNPECKPDVNHKNGIRNDNCVDNLEWATKSENQFHSFRILGRKSSMSMLGKKHPNHVKAKKILCLNNGIEYKSAKHASAELNVSNGSICNQIKGRTKTAKGFRFVFI